MIYGIGEATLVAITELIPTDVDRSTLVPWHGNTEMLYDPISYKHYHDKEGGLHLVGLYAVISKLPGIHRSYTISEVNLMPYDGNYLPPFDRLIEQRNKALSKSLVISAEEEIYDRMHGILYRKLLAIYDKADYIEVSGKWVEKYQNELWRLGFVPSSLSYVWNRQ